MAGGERDGCLSTTTDRTRAAAREEAISLSTLGQLTARVNRLAGKGELPAAPS